MGYGIKVEVWGDYACFSRPELKVERVSYDFITPSAARGIIQSVFWKPAIKYVIDEIVVCNPIKFTNVRRNEVNEKISMSNAKNKSCLDPSISQRASMILKDVRYIITLHFEPCKKWLGERDILPNGDFNSAKFYDEITRRLKKGQNFQMPCFGTREFQANIRFIDENESNESLPKAIDETRDFGLMLYDLDYNDYDNKKHNDPATEISPTYFMAKMVNGVVNLRDVELLK
jgi:CRISPR-associated protein Cas5d